MIPTIAGERGSLLHLREQARAVLDPRDRADVGQPQHDRHRPVGDPPGFDIETIGIGSDEIERAAVGGIVIERADQIEIGPAAAHRERLGARDLHGVAHLARLGAQAAPAARGVEFVVGEGCTLCPAREIVRPLPGNLVLRTYENAACQQRALDQRLNRETAPHGVMDQRDRRRAEVQPASLFGIAGGENPQFPQQRPVSGFEAARL